MKPHYRWKYTKLKPAHIQIIISVTLMMTAYIVAPPAICHICGIDPAKKKKVDFQCGNDVFWNAYFDVLHKPYEKDGSCPAAVFYTELMLYILNPVPVHINSGNCKRNIFSLVKLLLKQKMWFSQSKRLSRTVFILRILKIPKCSVSRRI